MPNPRDDWLRDEVLPLEGELRAYLRRYFGAEDVRDLVQQCYVQLCAMPDHEGIQSPRAFVFTLARNIAIQRLRHERIVPMDLVAEIEQCSDGQGASPSAERAYGAREELQRLARAVEQLPEQCRRVFTLRKVYGYSQKEIAQRLGIAENTVEKHVAKGVRLCAEYLASSPTPAKPRIVGRVLSLAALRKGERE